MRRSVLAISAGVMVLATTGEVEAQSKPSDVIQMYQQYANSSDAGKAAKIAALYTADAVALFSEGKFQGPSQIEQDLQAQFNNGWKNVTIKDEGGIPRKGAGLGRGENIAVPLPLAGNPQQ
jgi:hypothetical protein